MTYEIRWKLWGHDNLRFRERNEAMINEVSDVNYAPRSSIFFYQWQERFTLPSKTVSHIIFQKLLLKVLPALQEMACNTGQNKLGHRKIWVLLWCFQKYRGKNICLWPSSPLPPYSMLRRTNGIWFKQHLNGGEPVNQMPK